MSARYRVVPSTTYRPAQFALARRYERVEDAVAAMGEGVVLADDGRLVAFHERHLPFVTHTATTAEETR